MRSRFPETRRQQEETAAFIEVGEYLSSERDLYYVECVGPRRAVLEDCRTGMLLDVPLSEAQALQPVIQRSSRAA